MPIGLGDIVGQIGTGVYRLIKGKDVNIKAGANVTASSDGQYDDASVTDITIQPGDLILVDDVSVSYPDGAAGASGNVTGGGGQASTMTTSFASVWTFIQGQAGTGNGGLVPSAGSAGEFLAHDGSFAQVAYGNISNTPSIPVDLTSDGAGTIHVNNVPTLNQNTTGNAATVTTNANLTGHITSSGNATTLGSFTLAQLNTALSDATLAENTNTQNTTTLSFVDSSDDIILRNTTGGAGSGTDDIKFVAGANITLTHTDADNITIASSAGGVTISNNVDNRVLTGDGTNAVAEANLTYTGSILQNVGDIKVRNNAPAAANPGELIFLKARAGATPAGQNNDQIGMIRFQSYNDNNVPDLITYAQVLSKISDATNNQEAGRLELKVAEYDGTLTTGLKLEGDTDADGEVDVTIGAGAACTTTINGVVNLPNAAAGTVASGDHLGLDSNNNIVKTTGGSGGVSLSGSVANGIATYNTTNELSIETTLQFDSDQLLFSPTGGGATIKLRDITSGNSAGKSLRLTGSNAIGTDQIGGEIRISSGRGTGDKGGGDIDFFGSQIGQSSGTTSNTPKRMLQIAGATANVQIDNTNFPNAGFIGNNIGLVHDDALYLTPGDFNITSVARSDGDVYTNDNGGSVRPNSAAHNYHAFTYIPLGYKITHVQVEGSGGTFEVYTAQWSNDGTQQEGSQTTIGSTLDLSSSPLTSIAGKYVVIKWDPAATTNELYGAKITLARV